MKLYVVVLPEEVNARLAIFGGKVLAHLPNYFECSITKPENKDSSKQVFAIYPRDEDVKTFKDGGRTITCIWVGDKNSRQQANDLISVPITPVDFDARAMPSDVAKAALADYPEPVRLAAALSSASPELLSALPKLTIDLKAWADLTLEQYLGAAAK